MDNAEIRAQAALFEKLRDEVGRVVVGQEKILDRLLVAIACEGHVLLEGVPGITKTTLVRTLADALGLDFRRVSFTPDLLPSDVTGTQVYNPKDGTFTPKKGPVFANILLADEINRAPAKVQSALLEAMQERQVTIGDDSLALPDPFLVLATQNPIEQEGTYPLPEAQLDRFLFKCLVSFPPRADERRIMERFSRREAPKARAVASAADVEALRSALDAVYLDDKVADYILDVVEATRDPRKAGLDRLAELVDLGASPRASLCLDRASRAHARLRGRAYATPQDVKEIAPDVLRPRILLSYEAEAEGLTPDSFVAQVLSRVAVP
ncbi:MAG: MoxR family ATPase [Kiritimatiellae bacterium]|nr:MoxR family ATPase [Kiritimatiellia bacterium]